MATPDPRQAPATPAGLEEALQGLGLSSTERRAYQFLLERGASTPTEIAGATRQSRGRIYETLRFLVERGLAREEPSRPIRYSAAAPADVVRVALASAERQSALLKEAYGSLARTSRPAPAPLARTKPSDIAVLNGRLGVMDEIRRMTEAARQFLHLEGSERFADRIAAAPELAKALHAAQRRGVRVIIHLPPGLSAAARSKLERIVGAASVHLLSTSAAFPLVYAVSDQGGLLVHPQPDDASVRQGDDLGFRATSPAFAAELAARYALAVPSADGAHEKISPGDVPAAFARALTQARSEVVAFDPRAFEAPLAADGVPAALRRCAEKGVALRLLVSAGAASPPPRTSVPWEVRPVPWSPSIVAIVDRREMFQLVAHDETGQAPTLRASRDPQEVRFYLDLFERLWQQAPTR